MARLGPECTGAARGLGPRRPRAVPRLEQTWSRKSHGRGVEEPGSGAKRWVGVTVDAVVARPSLAVRVWLRGVGPAAGERRSCSDTGALLSAEARGGRWVC